MKPLFSIIINTFNNCDLIMKLIPSLLGEVGENKNKLIGEVIVVDNGSYDSTKYILQEFIKRYSDRIQVVTNEKNNGVVISRNQGLKLARYEYSMILDDDQSISDKTLKKYISALAKHDIVGYIPGMVSPSIGAKVVNMGESFNVIGEGGCAMKSVLWRKLKFFDESFSPCYFENVDLMLRAIQKFNATIGCIRNSEITHLESQTLGKDKEELGFDPKEKGKQNLEMLIGRLKSNYYGQSYLELGKYI